jgi:hypothetical protein
MVSHAVGLTDVQKRRRWFERTHLTVVGPASMGDAVQQAADQKSCSSLAFLKLASIRLMLRKLCNP